MGLFYNERFLLRGVLSRYLAFSFLLAKPFAIKMLHSKHAFHLIRFLQQKRYSVSIFYLFIFLNKVLDVF